MEPTQGRERILIIGGFGAGKSFTWSKIADWAVKRDYPGRVFVLDTDMAIDRMAVAFPEAFAAKVIGHDVFEFQDLHAGYDKFRNGATKDDFLVVDMVDKAWNLAEEHYIDQIFKKSTDNYFLEARKKNADGSPLDGWKDWGVINKVYNGWMINKVMRWPGHLICIAPAEPVISEGKMQDSPELQGLFGRFGVKPKGQKALGFQFHTVLLFQATKDTWKYSTIKDRSRPIAKGEEMKDFVANYLVKVAGWKL